MVSTAYVAGNKNGVVEEKLLEDFDTNILDIDIEAEIQSARRAKTSVEDESRNKTNLERFDKKAKKDLGQASGNIILSKRREQLRRSMGKKINL